MRWISSGLNFDTVFKLNSLKNILMQIQTLMYQIQGVILERLSRKI